MNKPWNAFYSQFLLEWRIQRSRAFVWFCAIAFFALSFASTLELGFSDVGYGWINGADAIANQAVILSVLGIIVAAGVVGDAMSRDRRLHTQEQVLALSQNPAALGLASFLAALLIVILIAISFIPAMLLASIVPGIAEHKLGPWDFSHYGKALVMFLLPNFLLVSALIYAVTTRSRQQTTGFMVALGLITLYITSLMLLGKDVYRHDSLSLYALLDPYGNIAGAEFSISWTVQQNNTQFRPLSGLLLQNRLLWLAIAISLIVLTYFSTPRYLQNKSASKRPFFKALAARRQTNKAKAAKSSLLAMNRRSYSHSQHEFQLQLKWQLLQLIRQPGMLLLLAFAALSLWWAAASAVTYAFSLPSTDLLLHNSGYYFDKVLILLIAWAAGDIVWREQQLKLDEIIDSQPSSDSWRLLAMAATLMIVVLVFWGVSIAVNLIYQISHGYWDLELDLYLIDTLFFKAPFYIWFALLALALQIIVRQRFIAMGICLLIFVSDRLFDALGCYHPLYRFGDTSFFWYSMMDGYGDYWRGHLWLCLYWSLACLILLGLAWGCYGRGTQLPSRRFLWRQKFTLKASRRPGAQAGLSLSVLLFLCTGAYIAKQSLGPRNWPHFDENAYMAAFEKRYKADWADRAQPRIIEIHNRIDLYPEKAQVDVEGFIRVQNQSDQPIDKLLVLFHPTLETMQLKLSDKATQLEQDLNGAIQIWQLNQALEPGASLDIGFVSRSLLADGFRLHNQHDGLPELDTTQLIRNGSSLMNLHFLPAIGYSERLEHKSQWERHKYALAGSWQPAKANVGKHIAHDTTHLAWVNKMTTRISTHADQIPLFSGDVIKDLGIIDGRRVVEYHTTKPARGWSDIISGEFSVYQASQAQYAHLPELHLYHHPKHDLNLAPFGDALYQAMDYFTQRYGQAPFAHYRVAETSLRHAAFGSRQGLASITEALAWKSNQSLAQGQDLHGYAAALMGMEWFASQLIPANSQGAKLIHSGLPYWSAALYLHAMRTAELSRELRLQDMQESYRKRSALHSHEQAFSDEIRDSTMIRTKGALSIIYLAERLGQAKLEQAIADFLAAWRYRSQPYPTAADFIQHLKARVDESYHQQIQDMFERIVNWQLGIVQAEAYALANGQWQIRARIKAEKWLTKNQQQIQLDMDTPVQIGVFKQDNFKASSVIKLAWHTLNNANSEGEFEVRFIVDEKPVKIGIDPYLLLPDNNPYDNVKAIKMIKK